MKKFILYNPPFRPDFKNYKRMLEDYPEELAYSNRYTLIWLIRHYRIFKPDHTKLISNLWGWLRDLNRKRNEARKT